MSGLPEEVVGTHGAELLAALPSQPYVRSDELTERTVERRLVAARETILAQATSRVPASREARNMATRFRKHGTAFFEFITTPGVDPTNNLAEQAIRFVVLDRKVTQGTRMRHKNYATTKKYINMARQLDGVVDSIHVPEFLKKAE